MILRRKAILLRWTVLIVALIGLATVPMHAGAEAEKSRESKPEHAPASLSELAWLHGSWTGTAFGGRVEEHWSAPAGASMMGMFRLVGANDKTVFCEFIMIEQEGPHVVGRFRHFGPKYKHMEPPDAPLQLKLVQATKSKAVFERDAESTPSRLTYEKTSDGQLSIRLQTRKDGVLDEGRRLLLSPENLGS